MIVLLMGPMGSGKTTVGRLLAERLRVPFLDADDLHPKTNRDKMAQGVSLDDRDREPWLMAVRERILPYRGKGPEGVLACSALKARYRDFLSEGTRIQWFYLKGDQELLGERLKGRQGHFASPKLLTGQLADLEEPSNMTWIDIRLDPTIIVDGVLKELEASHDGHTG
ncbi:MAG TPA: gluconokinase, GntK/IdnK-type [bacterium]|nr:gluconokinase, GntK/IdnK-type [bacterium]